ECKAKIVIIENVPQFVNSVHWQKLRDIMERLKYASDYWVLNAADFGAAQNRTRSFTIFSKIGLPRQPRPQKKVLTVRDAFAGLPTKPSMLGLDVAPVPS